MTQSVAIRGEVTGEITTKARIQPGYVTIKERVNSEQSNLYALNNLHNYIGKKRREKRRYA
jgi:hypothetical protein